MHISNLMFYDVIAISLSVLPYYVWHNVTGDLMRYKNALKNIREDRDLLQKDVSKVLGISQQYYSKYELGENELPLRHLQTLCEFYNVSADYLLGYTRKEIPLNKDKEKQG